MTLTLDAPAGVTITGPVNPGYEAILTPQALAFVAKIERAVRDDRKAALRARDQRQIRLDAGEHLTFGPSDAPARAGDWMVKPAPADLQDRRVEITGPVDRKMVINALNSGAKCFMADFEDASSPSWTNMVEGQINLRDAVARTIRFDDPKSGKHYTLNDTVATLIARARGWHLDEAHCLVDGEPVSGGVFDFALYVFHNHAALAAIGSGPYYYLPKMETGEEAAIWAKAFTLAEDELGLARGTIRATVLIETITATFQLDEILYALKDHITALNCGRWDYIFSYIKRFRKDASKVLPDRALVGMNQPFMEAYAKLVIETCHRRGAHAMGGMSAFIPVKGDEAANQRAFDKLTEDKLREVKLGHDGTWVAHPGMVAAAKAVFDEHMPQANQVARIPGYTASERDLIAAPVGPISEDGVRTNISVGVQYVASWLRGQGAAPINNLMEDAATAEISRAQLWQWRVHGRTTTDGAVIDEAYLRRLFDEELAKLSDQFGEAAYTEARLPEAADIMRDLTFEDGFVEFLTLPAYERIKSV